MTVAQMAALGLLSSLHCAAMCGPLVVAGTGGLGPADRRRRLVGYLGARVLSYATVGAALGVVGQHALCDLPVSTVQVVASLGVAVFAAWQGVRVLRERADRAADALLPLGRRKPGRLVALLGTLLPRRGAALGAVTAFLPCGALLGAYAAAATTASAPRAAGLMAIFAITSAPGLVAPGLLRLVLGRRGALGASAQALGWWALAVYSALRPLFGQHHH